MNKEEKKESFLGEVHFENGKVTIDLKSFAGLTEMAIEGMKQLGMEYTLKGQQLNDQKGSDPTKVVDYAMKAISIVGMMDKTKGILDKAVKLIEQEEAGKPENILEPNTTDSEQEEE